MNTATDVTIGSTKDQIVRLLGTPLKETVEDGYTVLWYGSSAGTLADIVYLSGDTVSAISISHYQKRTSLVNYTELYGKPEQSVWNSAVPNDSLRLIVHMWPAQGRAVVAVGPNANAEVIREDHFEPTTLAGYLAGWGKDYAGHIQVSIISVSPTSTAQQVSKSPQPVEIYWVVAGVIAAVVVVAIIVLVRKRFISRVSS